MASIGFPSHAKVATLPSGTTYGYVYIPQTDPSKPTILFLHGIPSTSYDWHHQIRYFSSKGYGILAPDLLGYGDTDKPSEVSAYIFKRMAADVDALLAHENIKKVHAVGHDFGCIFLSTYVCYYPQRFLSTTFLAVPYTPPGKSFDFDLMETMTEEVLGFERFGYMKFFNQEDSWKLMDEHSESFLSLMYGSEEETAMKFYPAGALESSLKSNYIAPDPAWMTPEYKATLNKIWAKGGYRGLTNWYRMHFFQKLGKQEELDDIKDPRIPCRTLWVEQSHKSIVHLSALSEITPKYAADCITKVVGTTGHWVQFEASDEVNSMLEKFFEGTLE